MRFCNNSSFFFFFHDEGQFVDIRLTAMECLVDYVRVEGSESDLSHLLALIEGLWKNELWRVQKDYLHLQISPIDLDVMSVLCQKTGILYQHFENSLVRKLFKFSLRRRKTNAETIWIFQGFTNSKKNSCRGNYMRQYGMQDLRKRWLTLRNSFFH